MHTLARFPAREARLKRQVGIRAFTLIELLTVIAIIAILAGITFGVVKGVNERAAIGQTKAELAVLSQALEAYKMRYGDYPWTIDRAEFYRALNGKIGPKGAVITGGGKRFIETSKLAVVSSAGANATDHDATGNYLVDPWGRDYKYRYKTGDGTAWRSPSYILYSSGPSTTSETAPDAAGVINTTAAGNFDNIYANK